MPLTGRFQGGTEATCLSGVYGPRSRSLKAAVVPKEDTREGGAVVPHCGNGIHCLYFLYSAIMVLKLRLLWENIRSIKGDKKAIMKSVSKEWSHLHRNHT